MPVRQHTSCTRCAARKVRCDKARPCSACTNHKVDCVYDNVTQEPVRKRRKIDLPALSGDTLLKQVNGLLQKYGADPQRIATSSTTSVAPRRQDELTKNNAPTRGAETRFEAQMPSGVPYVSQRHGQK